MQDRRAINVRYQPPRIERRPNANELPPPSRKPPATGWKKRRIRCPACGRTMYDVQAANVAYCRMTCYCKPAGTPMVVLMTVTIRDET